MELARLLLADFDQQVEQIYAQPFRLAARLGGRVRHHVPDFLLVSAAGTARLVNVKPAERLQDPQVAEALAWPGALAKQRGWEYEVWSGADATMLENVRFLAGYRRPGVVHADEVERAWECVQDGEQLADAELRLAGERPRHEARPALLACWPMTPSPFPGPWPGHLAAAVVVRLPAAPGAAARLLPGLPPPAGPWNARRLGPRAGGACTRDNPASAARRGGCGTDLTAAEAVPLPAGGLVLAAHQHLAALMTSAPGRWPAAVTELREVYATACRVLRGLHAIPGQAPPAVHAVLDEADVELPWRDGAEPGDDARTAAIGATLACLALDQAYPEHEELFGWILQADRSLLRDRPYTPASGPWPGGGPGAAPAWSPR